MNHKNNYFKVLQNIVLVLISLIVIFPVLVMISNSFKLPNDLFVNKIQLIPETWTFNNYIESWKEYDVSIWFVNSVATTIGIVVLQLLICLLATYALAFENIKYKDLIFSFFIASMVIPFQVTMIPNYVLISKMHLMNTWMGVIFPNIANAFGIFLLHQYFYSFPYSLYEAAVVEGCNSWDILWKIVVPISKAFLSALLILFFIDAWNLYFWPLLVMHIPESKTLSIGLQQYIDFELGNRWGPFMATATLASLPTLVIYGFMQKQIISTYAKAGIKG